MTDANGYCLPSIELSTKLTEIFKKSLTFFESLTYQLSAEHCTSVTHRYLLHLHYHLLISRIKGAPTTKASTCIKTYL